MVRRSPKKCNVIGCPNLTHDSYCDLHKHSHRRAQDRLYKRYRRDKKEQRFYSSSAWIRLRNNKRAKNPLCEHCLLKGKLKPVDVVDHIVPLKVAWDRRLDPRNLQSLCHSCHNKKTAEDMKKYEQLRQ